LGRRWLCGGDVSDGGQDFGAVLLTGNISYSHPERAVSDRQAEAARGVCQGYIGASGLFAQFALMNC
jgi:hypothetical protein